MSTNVRTSFLQGGAKLLAVLLLIVAFFLLGILMSPPATPVHALNFSVPTAALAPADQGVNGTLASFTALIPELTTLHLPIIIK